MQGEMAVEAQNSPWKGYRIWLPGKLSMEIHGSRGTLLPAKPMRLPPAGSHTSALLSSFHLPRVRPSDEILRKCSSSRVARLKTMRKASNKLCFNTSFAAVLQAALA
jgi:hypothetical protein